VPQSTEYYLSALEEKDLNFFVCLSAALGPELGLQLEPFFVMGVFEIRSR
jgi:hypothetical protein